MDNAIEDAGPAHEQPEPVICRLCTSTKSGQLQIFGKEGEDISLARKIEECLSIQIREEDKLTKSVCDVCIAKVEDILQFQQSCVEAQASLRDSYLKENGEAERANEAAVAEAEKIMERLQAGGSALSITPVKASTSNSGSTHVTPDLFHSKGALSITPVEHNSDSSDDEDSLIGSSQSILTLPRLKSPCTEDYVLMLEETLKVDPIRSQSKQDPVEYSKKAETTLKDWDVLEAQFPHRVVLPPMWDVFEKDANKENIIHRRYVVSKNSFPCSLCGSCVAFHRQQQVLQLKKQDFLNTENQQQDLYGAKQEFQNGKIASVKDLQYNVEEQIMKDLRAAHNPSQEVGMLDCPECGKVFPRRSSWKRHLRTHYEGRAFVCPVCLKGFNRKEHLSRHMLSHSGGRPFHCETCFKPFTRKEHLARHLACNIGCGGTMANVSSAVENDSGIPRPFTCDICYQTFSRKEHMLRHRKRTHLVDDLYATPSSTNNEKGVTQRYRSFEREHMDRQTETHLHEFSLNLKNLPNNTVSNFKSSSNIKVEEDDNSPEQIEVEVNLVEGSDGDEGGTGEDTVAGQVNSNKSSSFMMATSTSDGEDVEMDEEDVLRMQMNEAMRQAREGIMSSGNQTPHCEVCQKSFTRKCHLVRHLRRFHPHVELAYAAAYSLGKAVNSNCVSSDDALQVLSVPSPMSVPSREDEEEADDESISLTVGYPAPRSRSKGGQHPCSICGKMFGRRYHLVRHRRTQHGVESVEAGRTGRPPKRPALNLTANSQAFRCSLCGSQFVNHREFRSHTCTSNNNTITTKSGSCTLAEMAAKVSNKLLKGKDHLCQTCGEKFYSEQELEKHVESHVSELMEGMLWT